jgi:DNA-binding Xre family transcriptional regulator
MEANFKSKILRRIEKIMRHYSLSTKEFSFKTGIQKSTVDVMTKSDQCITLSMFSQICAVFPQINVRWLLLGEGDFLIETINDKLPDNKLKINILVENFKIPLEIERIDEEMYRLSGKYLNEKINAQKHEYQEIEIDKIIKRVGFYLAVEIVKNQKKEKPKGRKKSPKICLYRQAAIYYREKLNFYCDKYPDFELQKLYSLTAYHFAVIHQRTIVQ